MSGIKTENLPLTTAVSELIGHDRQDSTARIRLSSLSTLIGHEVAGDIAASGGIGVFDTVGAGSDAVSNGAFFAVKGSGDIYLSLYQKVSGAAQKVGELPSLEAVSTLIGSATLATNWDAIDRSGFYRGAPSSGETIGAPEGDTGQMRLLHVEGTQGRATQVAFRNSTNAPQVWIRSSSTTGWSQWEELAWQSSLDAIAEGVEALTGEATLATDWDAIEKSGFYRGSDHDGETGGAPSDAGYLGLLHIEKGGDRSHQLAFRNNLDNPQVWVRVRTPSGWGEWEELAARAHVDAEASARAAADEILMRAADAAMDQASEPSYGHGEFHGHEQQPKYAVAGEAGEILLGVSDEGFLIEHYAGEFHGQLPEPSADLLHLDEGGRILTGLGSGGGGGGDYSVLPQSEEAAPSGTGWRGGGRVMVARNYHPWFSAPESEVYTTAASLYAQYDALMAAHPDYISRYELGEDSLGNKIYEYRAVRLGPHRIGEEHVQWQADEINPPKVIVCSGTHGNERLAMLATLLFAQELCNNWRRDDRLAALRWDCEIVFVPCVSPSTVNTSSRTNHNGVNINRNYPYLWDEVPVTTPGDNGYGGPSAASELETQVIMTLPDRHPDAAGCIDYHNYGDFDVYGYLAWTVTIGEAHKPLMLEHVNAMQAWAQREIAAVQYLTHRLTRVTKSRPGQLVGWLTVEKGIPAYIIEAAQEGGLGSLLNARRLALEQVVDMTYRIYRKEAQRRASLEA